MPREPITVNPPVHPAAAAVGAPLEQFTGIARELTAALDRLNNTLRQIHKLPAETTAGAEPAEPPAADNSTADNSQTG